MFSDLPSDLEDMDESLGPPPAWFSTFYSRGISPNVFQPGYLGLGDRQGELEVNPVERLEELKYKQEMPKRIPIEANRYTDIDPISPLFRAHKAKYGFGTWDSLAKNKLIPLGLVVLVIYLYNRSK